MDTEDKITLALGIVAAPIMLPVLVLAGAIMVLVGTLENCLRGTKAEKPVVYPVNLGDYPIDGKKE